METARPESEVSFLFFAFLAGFAFIVLLEYLYPELFRRDTRHLFYFSGLTSQQRNVRTYAAYQALSVVLFGFTFALFFSTYLARRYFDRDFSFSLMGAVFVLALAFLLLRYLADRFLAWLFDVHSLAGAIMEKRIAFQLAFGVYGLALFFIFTYSGFSPAGFEEKVLVWFFVLYILIYVAVMAEYLVGSAEYFFYFIFYLCIVEICPVLVVWNMLKRTLA